MTLASPRFPENSLILGLLIYDPLVHIPASTFPCLGNSMELWSMKSPMTG